MKHKCFFFIAGALSVLGNVYAFDSEITYNRDVRPILSEHCFACHGFDAHSREADLRLDEKESAFSDRGGMAAIVPRDLERSEVWKRIISSDPDEIMPPPSTHQVLSADDKETLRKWIEAGAPYQNHWSFEPPVKAPLPANYSNLHPIDAFVRQRLDRESMSPQSEADKESLVRRLYVDLIGLPPSGAEIDAFINDSSPNAYETLVDRLLASSHFGERFALDWLDAARYADTNGFSIDGGRHMWLWRDWVIQSLNDNLSYDQFLLQQIAGDLLPDATLANKIATGFQRNNMVTHEGGTIPEENLTNYGADRVKTFGEAMLGLTLSCAQCHDHKYDPISQREYFQLFAYFNTLSDRGLDGNGGNNPAPSIQAITVLKSDEPTALQQSIAALQESMKKIDHQKLNSWMERTQAKLELRGKDLQLHPVKALKVSTPNRGSGFEIEEERFVVLESPGALAAFDILAELPPIDRPITGIRATIYPEEKLGNGWGYGKESEEKKSFVLTAIAASVDRVPGDQVDLFGLLPFGSVTANSWKSGFPPGACLDPRNDSGWAPELSFEGPVHLSATFQQPIDSTQTPYLTTQLNFGFGQSYVARRIALEVFTGIDDGTDIPKTIVELLVQDDASIGPSDREALWKYYVAHSDDFERERIDLANLTDRLAALTTPFTTMVMDVAKTPRKTFLLNRGDYSQPTEEVQPGIPNALPKPSGEATDRLGLAQWLVMKENPLTSRVAVNRYWKLLFGTGIVATPADFGSQGEWPSHPELLDWLAVDFVESGWDLKHLLKSIVMSQTYRQSSVPTPESLERDPGNRLLSRGARFRLPAELIRDAALKTSGLLVDRIGGPSVNPYMPMDLWREVSHYGSTPATAQTFVQDHGEKLYRRSLYTYWKRTAPPPNMVTFDAPNREVCTIERGSTTTPLQALVTLNDTQFVEAARNFADRIITCSSGDREVTQSQPDALARDSAGNHAANEISRSTPFVPQELANQHPKHSQQSPHSLATQSLANASGCDGGMLRVLPVTSDESGQPGSEDSAVDDGERLKWAFRESTSRYPTEDELKVLVRALTRERERYRGNVALAIETLSVGESPQSTSIPPEEHAAWMQVAALILNLSESLTRP